MTDSERRPRQWGDSSQVMALTLAALYLAGAATGALTLVLPHPNGSDDPMLWTNVVIALVGGIAVGALAKRLPPWSLQVAIAIGTLLVTRAIYLSYEEGFYSFWYVWVGLYTFFFFGPRWGMVHLGLVGVAYGWALTQVPASSPIARWVMTVGTIAIAGLLIDVLARRVRRRANEADAQARALTAVADVAHELARRTSPEAAALAVCEAAVDVSAAKRAVLWEASPSGNGLVAIAATDAALVGMRIPFVGRPSGAVKAFTSVRPCFADDGGSAVLARESRASAEEGSALFQPVSQDGVPMGVLGVYWPRRLTGLSDELSRVIDLLSVEAAIAIERASTLARLERVARTDDLTGLANRRAWDEHLHRELARARREESPLSIALLDLDHFKLYNDQHGHQAGDRLLKEAAATWGGLIRETDILARYGGEEFALALPGADCEQALETLERLRIATPLDEHVSAGVASWDGEQSEIELLAAADRALYSAKDAGRDRIIVA